MVLVTVIGGGGRMGAWFASFLKRNGYIVTLYDKNLRATQKLARKLRVRLANDLKQAVRSAQLVLFTTPTQATKVLLPKIAPYLSPDSLVVEISSVKAPVKDAIRDLQKRGIDVLSIHPMFGPGTGNLARKTILVVAAPRRNALAKKFISLLRRTGARLILTNFDAHDRVISTVLALPHFVNIAMIRALRSIGRSPDELREIAGTTFKLQLLTAEAILQEDLDNEVSLLSDGKHAVNPLDIFVRETVSLRDAVKKRKRRLLLRSLIGARNFVRKDRYYATAYPSFNAAVEATDIGILD